MPNGIALSGVGASFCAAHRSPEGEMHGHTYEVIAWFEFDQRQDARVRKAALERILSAWDHKTLPDDLAWGEDIARAVALLAGCVEVEIKRQLEGFYARWRTK